MTPARTATPGTTSLAVASVVLTLAGVAGYFIITVHVAAAAPWLRNYPVACWLVIALGGALAVRAVIRAPHGRRLVPSILLGADGVLTVLFALFLYVLTAVPPATGPAVGLPAPGFALPDQTGRTVRLEHFRGRPVLLVFYRGHW